jgi:hypothetical protein
VQSIFWSLSKQPEFPSLVSLYWQHPIRLQYRYFSLMQNLLVKKHRRHHSIWSREYWAFPSFRMSRFSRH